MKALLDAAAQEQSTSTDAQGDRLGKLHSHLQSLWNQQRALWAWQRREDSHPDDPGLQPLRALHRCLGLDRCLAEKYHVDDITYIKKEKLGEGMWADIFRAEGPSGDVAIKRLRDLTEKHQMDPLPPRNETEQHAELAIECRLHRFVQEQVAELASPGQYARVPRLIGSEARLSAIECIGPPAVTLREYLEYARTPDVAEMRSVRRVCCIIVKKVLGLLQALAGHEFSHRDLNTGNIFVQVKDDRVRGVDDVEVWLFDFGKSMARVDGQQLSAGMWVKPGRDDPPIPTVGEVGYDAARIFQFNPTTDSLRFLCSMSQKLILSYNGGQLRTAPTGHVRDFLLEHMPFGPQLSAWLAHLRATMGEEEFGRQWDEGISNARRRGPLKNESGQRDFLDFTTEPCFTMMIQYYQLPRSKLCREIMPQALIESADAVLAE